MRRFDEGNVASGIGLKKFLGQSIMISELRDRKCVLGVSGVTTGLAPNTEVQVVVTPLASSSGIYDEQVITGVVDSKGRFEIRIPLDTYEFKLFDAVASTADHEVLSNRVTVFQYGYYRC
jgi:hypothetical protein